MTDSSRTEAQKDAAAKLAATRVNPVTEDRVRAALDAASVPWFVDHEGDFGIPWRRGNIRLDLWDTGKRASVLLLSATWHRRPTIERLGSLLCLADELNAASDGVKTYLRVLDDGDILVCFEGAFLAQTGASDRQLQNFVHTTLSTVFDLVAHLEHLFPDPLSFPEVDE